MILPGPIASTGVDIPRGQSAGCLGVGFDPVFLDAIEIGRRRPRRIRRRLRADQLSVGVACWRAHLVEAGVRVVTVNMFDTVFGRVSWDCHGASPFSTFDDYARELLPDFDRAFGALLDDLERTGRLDSTLVVAAGEFGRSPRINASGGRDHWPGVWTVALAGGGIRGGQVVGASDPTPPRPPTDPSPFPTFWRRSIRASASTIGHASRPSDGRSMTLVEDGRTDPRTLRLIFGTDGTER